MFDTIEYKTIQGSGDQFQIAKDAIIKKSRDNGYSILLRKVLQGIESFYIHFMDSNYDTMEIDLVFYSSGEKCKFSIRFGTTNSNSLAFWAVVLALTEDYHRKMSYSSTVFNHPDVQDGAAELLHVFTHSDSKPIISKFGEREIQPKGVDEIKMKLMKLLGVNLELASHPLKESYIVVEFEVSNK